MAESSLNCYAWLAEALHASGNITREELDYRWSLCPLNETHETRIPDETFRAVNELLRADKRLNECVLLEDMPSGARFLMPLLETISAGRVVLITYQGFDADSHDFELEVYCLKLFKQRWYVVGRSSDHPDEVRVYALDRVLEIKQLPRTYIIPPDFSPTEFFRNFYGVWVSEAKPERVVVRTTVHGAYFLRSLPLHHSQREIEHIPDTTFSSGDGYSVFEFWIVPTYDFQQELQTHGAELQVLEPQWLVERFRQLGAAYTRIYSHPEA